MKIKKLLLRYIKKIMESIGETVFPSDISKALFICSMAMATSLASIVRSFGIQEKDLFLANLMLITQEILSDLTTSHKLMEYSNGKKVRESTLN
jgi:hypothetical protein